MDMREHPERGLDIGKGHHHRGGAREAGGEQRLAA